MIRLETDQLDRVIQRFGELREERRMMEKRKNGAIAPSRLYAHILGQSDGEVDALLGQDLNLRRIYRNLLQQGAMIHMPETRAASSEDYPARYVQGCKLRLQQSRAQDDQLYLIIEMADQRSELPETLHLVGLDQKIARLQLPAGRNGVIQTIIDKGSDIAQMLGDPKTEIFLR